MGRVIYHAETNAVLADVRIVPAHAVAAGVYQCDGFTIHLPRGLFGAINVNSGDYTMYEFGM